MTLSGDGVNHHHPPIDGMSEPAQDTLIASSSSNGVGCSSNEQQGPSTRAVLISRPNSHQFQDRSLNLEQPAKIGRAVARCKPSTDNAIFDCKVLSRNHALLWQEHGKFYLQDTRSSNGTFVNNKRLSPANEESAAKSVYSGDVVQFGVNVIENSKKVTHGCIVATLKLYTADGCEAICDQSELVGGNHYLSGVSGQTTVSAQNLYLLAQCLKEASVREDVLRRKLAMLQKVIQSTQEKAEEAWKCMVEEDRLLSRIESLQAKLELVLKAHPASLSDEKMASLRAELDKLDEEREEYQGNAKTAIKKSIEEKMTAEAMVYKLEISLASAEEEVSRLREAMERMEKDMGQLCESHEKQTKDLEEVVSARDQLEEKLQALMESNQQERDRDQKLLERLAEYQAKEAEMQTELTELHQRHPASGSSELLTITKCEKNLNDIDALPSNYVLDGLDNGQTDMDVVLDITGAIVNEKCSIVNETINENELITTNQTIIGDSNGNALLPLLNGNSSPDGVNNLVNNSKQVLTDQLPTPSSATDEQHTSQLISEVELLRELLAEARLGRKSLEEKVAKLEGEISNLSSTCVEHKTLSEIYRNELDNVQASKVRDQEDLESLKETLHDLETNFTHVQEEKNSLSRQLAQLKRVKQKSPSEIVTRGVVNPFSPENKEKLRQNHVPPKSYSTLPANFSSPKTSCAPRIIFSDGPSLKSQPIFGSNEIEKQIVLITDQLNQIKSEKEEQLKEKEVLFQELRVVKEEYELVSYQNKMATACAIVPLLILFLAFLFAHYPSVSTATGTIEPDFG